MLWFRVLVALQLPLTVFATFNWPSIKNVLAFGDSYTYVQGTAGLQNFSFIGDYLDLSFTPDTLLSDRIVQNQTATAEGGPNWVEFLTECGVIDGLTDPKFCPRQLWDFAFAGADISLQYTALHHNFTTPLVNQTQQFIEYGYPVLNSTLTPEETLVIFWIGINDIGDTAGFTNVSSFADFYNELQDTLFDSVNDVRDLGYDNFLFMNLPPLDHRPGATATSLPNKTMIDWWDGALVNHSQVFAQDGEVTSLLFDVNLFLNGVIADAGSYGITNTTGYCASYDQPDINTDPEGYGCAPLSEYFW